MTRILVSPEELSATAESVFETAEQVRTLYRKMNRSLRKTAVGWKGIRSNRFFDDYPELQTEMDDLLVDLNAMGLLLKRAAKDFRSADNAF